MMLLSSVICSALLATGLIAHVTTCFQAQTQVHSRRLNVQFSLNLFGSGSGKVGRIPSSSADRNNLAFDAIKAAIASPKNKDFPLIEVEFPPLEALNKLGDGSLRSSIEVDTANLLFASKLLASIAPLPFLGPKMWLLASSASSSSFLKNAKKSAGSAQLFSLRDGLPKVSTGDVCILLSPSSRGDYEAAQRIATAGIAKAVVVVNGFAKDERSIPAGATMAYYLKPLTYNSQVVGYLTRAYPGNWVTIDALTKEVLSSQDDVQILVPKTNTPDLRASGKVIQKSVDARAIKARRG